MDQTTLFWSQKRKKEIRASLCPLQPDTGEKEEEEEEEEEEKEEEGEGEGEEGGRGSRRTCGPRRLCEGASPAFRRGAGGWRRAT